jgi:steroid 5-alpha reductase family enzyme
MILSIIIVLTISYILLFTLSILLKDNSIADIFWGLGFLQVTIHSLIISSTFFISQIILLILILLWSLRISFYILSKKIIKKGEDPRYVIWRKTWKYFYLRSFFQVYMIQGFLLLIIAIPIFLINYSPPDLNFLTLTGLVISSLGLIYETIADLQLRSFVKNKGLKIKEKIMKKGLWRYSRHPNYFGESLFWLGISIIAFQISFLTLLSWTLITILLRFVSGVPLAEARYKDNKEFMKYKKTTPPMFPNFFIK